MLKSIHAAIDHCRACPNMLGPPVHGPAVVSPIFLLGQAPGVHEGRLGRPFAYTAGKTLFRWFHEACGISESQFRNGIYMAAVARCFPGKAAGGGDRLPDATEIAQCKTHLRQEVALLQPQLIIAVGKLAIGQVLGPQRYPPSARLHQVVGGLLRGQYLGHTADVVCLPHPSGLSAWPKVEPGKTLLRAALDRIAQHPCWQQVFPT